MDGGLVYAAGLWEQWQRQDAGSLASCTMLIGPPLPELEHIHPRMPVLIPEAMLDEWFSAPPEQAMALLQALPQPRLGAVPVEGPIAADWTEPRPSQ